jgi:hypothetical protein
MATVEILGVRIVAAAVKINGVTVSVPAPGRHYNILAQLPARMARGVKPSDQGFLTDTGHFLRRGPALFVARREGQLLKDTTHEELYSEDLW